MKSKVLFLKDFSYLFFRVCARAKVTLKALRKHQSSGGGGHAGSSLPVPHSPPWMKRPAVPCPGLAARRLPRRQAPCRREGRSASQEQAQRFQGGKRLPGRADPLVRTASPTATSGDAVFAYCLFNKATLYDVYAFSRGKAEWVMAIWCSNFLMVRVGGQMLPYLIVKWIRKYRFWINITDRVVKKNSCVARKPSHNKVTDFASFIRSFSDHQERRRSWSSLFTCTFWTEQM